MSYAMKFSFSQNTLQKEVYLFGSLLPPPRLKSNSSVLINNYDGSRLLTGLICRVSECMVA